MRDGAKKNSFDQEVKSKHRKKKNGPTPQFLRTGICVVHSPDRRFCIASKHYVLAAKYGISRTEFKERRALERGCHLLWHFKPNVN